jgi:hypothetical protein
MTRTPLAQAVVTLAAVQFVAHRRGVPADVIRAGWARAREGRRPERARGDGSPTVTRRAFLLSGGAMAAWMAPADRLRPRRPSP